MLIAEQTEYWTTEAQQPSRRSWILSFGALGAAGVIIMAVVLAVLGAKAPKPQVHIVQGVTEPDTAQCVAVMRRGGHASRACSAQCGRLSSEPPSPLILNACALGCEGAAEQTVQAGCAGSADRASAVACGSVCQPYRGKRPHPKVFRACAESCSADYGALHETSRAALRKAVSSRIAREEKAAPKGAQVNRV